VSVIRDRTYDSGEREVLDEEAFGRVPVVLEDPVLLLPQRNAAYLGHAVEVEEPLWRPGLALLASVVLGVTGVAQVAPLDVVVDPRDEFEDDLVLGGVHVLHLGQVVLPDGPLQAHPRARLELHAVLDHAQHVRHLLEGHHLAKENGR